MEENKIPIEILPRIFVNLDDGTLSNCRLACRTFNELINTKRFWIQYAKENDIILTPYSFPPKKWEDAAKNNQFGGGLSIDSSKFKFNYRKIVTSKEGVNNSIMVEFQNDGTVSDLKSEAASHRNRPTKCRSWWIFSGVTSYSPVYCYSQIDIYRSLSEFGIDNWVMDHVRPKITITFRFLMREDIAKFKMIAELNYEKGYFKHGRQIINVSADNKRRKEISIVCSRSEQDEWGSFSIAFDDYPSGLRSFAIMIRSDYEYGFSKILFERKSISPVHIAFVMPDDVKLKPFKKDEEDIEDRRYCETCERYITDFRDHDCRYRIRRTLSRTSYVSSDESYSDDDEL